MQFQNGIHIDEATGKVTWLKPNYRGDHEQWKNSADMGTLYIYNEQSFVWTFPVDIFNAFRKTIILTYMFDGQLQSAYYKLHEVGYKYIHVKPISKTDKYDTNQYMFEDAVFDKPQPFDLSKYKELITICEDTKLNAIGDEEFDLSKTWYRKRVSDEGKDDEYFMDAIRRHYSNFFRHTVMAKARECMWTTFKKEGVKDFKNLVKDRNYGIKYFVPCNARATNQYRDRKALAYLINRYIEPVLKNFFSKKSIPVDEDKFALSELLQWMFRSQIRDDKPISIYIPSARMRTLLKDWMDGKF